MQNNKSPQHSWDLGQGVDMMMQNNKSDYIGIFNIKFSQLRRFVKAHNILKRFFFIFDR